ncbi:MAG TPA: protein phosphatase 2C domain-containing protein [Acidocella sp.]|jgi:protein phosphatase/serine/threonine-protein phosphatase Stp1|nr:protein phosphatase 2C domain-containing protein [Acidocella sp.]
MTVTKSWARTDVGAVRKHNEDNLLHRPDIGLWVVADGAGGHDSGEVASGLIVSSLDQLASAVSAPELLSQVRHHVGDVHLQLRDMAAARGGNSMIASTFVGLIIRDGHFACLWAGDSRAYLLRHGTLSQISRDHSLVQELVDSGHLAPEDAETHPHANIITRAVGADADTLELDKVIGETEPGDRFLLCSDGLTKTLSDPEIAAVLSRNGEASPADRLIAAALAQDVNDNVTAVVVDVV